MTESIAACVAALGLGEPLAISRIKREEDESFYDVWLVELSDRKLIVKKEKGREGEIYRAFFRAPVSYAPQLIGVAGEYLVTEYISGENLCACTRQKLIPALDSLIAMQKDHWQTESFGYTDFGRALAGRKNRGKYLNHPKLEQVYAEFLEDFQSIPRTLCHDDLLPFNVTVSEGRAVFIDWEVGGILPYPVSLARLIAHGEEAEDAFFHMKAEDKAFAIDYYYENCIRHWGISRENYDRTMRLAIFYELCEWIYLGNRYPDADMERYRIYKEKALRLAEEL